MTGAVKCRRLAIALAAFLCLGLALAASLEALRPLCGGKRATIASDDRTIHGTRGPDVIVGGRGPNRIAGGGGNDVICGGYGRDRIDGGRGKDTLDGKKDADLVLGGRGSASTRSPAGSAATVSTAAPGRTTSPPTATPAGRSRSTSRTGASAGRRTSV